MRMKKREQLNENKTRNKQSWDCDKQGGDRGHVHNLKTLPQSFPSTQVVLVEVFFVVVVEKSLLSSMNLKNSRKLLFFFLVQAT